MRRGPLRDRSPAVFVAGLEALFIIFDEPLGGAKGRPCRRERARLSAMVPVNAHAPPAAAGGESTAPSAEDAGQAGRRVDRSGPRLQRLGGTEAPLLFRLLFDEARFRAGAHFRAAAAGAAAAPSSAAGVGAARCAVRVGPEWSLSCWLRTPLEVPRGGGGSGGGGGGIYTLASAGGHAAAECHVQVRASADGAPARLGVFATSPASPDTPTWHPLTDDARLQRLPAGWHSLVAVGGGGATTFYINGRACGEVRAQARSAIARLGGGAGGGAGVLTLADALALTLTLAPNPHPHNPDPNPIQAC